MILVNKQTISPNLMKVCYLDEKSFYQFFFFFTKGWKEILVVCSLGTVPSFRLPILLRNRCCLLLRYHMMSRHNPGLPVAPQHLDSKRLT